MNSNGVTYSLRQLQRRLRISPTTLWRYRIALGIDDKDEFSEGDRYRLKAYKLYAKAKKNNPELTDDLFIQLVNEQGLVPFLKSLQSEYGVYTRHLVRELQDQPIDVDNVNTNYEVAS